MSNLIIRDNKGRTLLEVKGGRCLVSRFTDMSKSTKDFIIEIFTDLTGNSDVKVRKFLDFESEEQEFCS